MSRIVKAKMLYCSSMGPDTGREKRENSYLKEAPINNREFYDNHEIIVKQAVKKAQQIEDEAKNRANALVEAAIKNSQKIQYDAEKRGFEEGYRKGFEAGEQASMKAAEQGLSELNEIVQTMNLEQEEAIKRQEKDLTQIAFELAKKIMKQQVQIDEETIPKMLEEIIQENRGEIRIYLSENQKFLDLLLDKAIGKKLRSLYKNTKVVFVKEADLIMIETENGIIDVSVSEQYGILEKAVFASEESSQ